MKKIAIIICMLSLCLVNAKEKKPNIIIMLADDMGFGCINVNGAPENLLKTPHINSLAKEGMNFTGANTPSSVCSPTRYAMLTGVYTWRTEHGPEVWGLEPLVLKPERLTIQKMLQEQGYKTGMVGKWHLGYGKNTRSMADADLTDDYKDSGINSTGFDYSFAIPQNHGDMTGVWTENDEIWNLRSKNRIDVGNCWYGAKYHGYDAPQRVNEEAVEKCTEMAVKWLKTLPKDKPFFLYFANPAIHHPFTPSKKNQGKSGCGTFGDFIMDIDDSVGALISYLKEIGEYDNTLFIFTADNGTPYMPLDFDLEEAKRKNMKEDRFQLFEAVSKGLKPNGDYRGGKHMIFDGGTRVPFIVRWPAGNIPAGKSNAQTFGLIDIMATLADVTGYKLDNGINSGLDSVDVLEIWKNKPFHRANLVTANPACTLAIRDKDMKYLEGKFQKNGKRVENSKNPQDKVQLYDIKNDISESNDLIDTKKDIANKMQKDLDTIKGMYHYKTNPNGVK